VYLNLIGASSIFACEVLLCRYDLTYTAYCYLSRLLGE